MTKFFQNIIDGVKAAWTKWKPVQKLIFFGIVAVIIIAIIALAAVNSRPSSSAIFGSAITDVSLQDRVSARLDTEGVKYRLSAGMFNVNDDKTARRARAILVREDLTPGNIDPWNLFDMQRWTTTQFLDNVNLQRSLTKQLKLHIESLDDVDNANVTIAVPKDELFAEDRSPSTVSVVITPRPGSDINKDQKKIQGIAKLIQFAVPNLKPDNITILDNQGNLLNDFSMMEVQNRLQQGQAELKQKKSMEQDYYHAIKDSLEGMFPGRVRVVKVDLALDTDIRQETGTKYEPIEMEPQDPTKPYNTRKVVPNVVISQQTANVDFTGTGFNPEGPAGQEGQTPPAYQDLQNANGKYTQATNTSNYGVSHTDFKTEKSPWSIARVAISVAIDGVWTLDKDATGNTVANPDGSLKRTYAPVDDASLRKVSSLVQAAVGYNQTRGDEVSVQNIAFDRSAQFLEDDERYKRAKLIRMLVLWGAVAIGVIVIFLLAYRAVSKEMTRRRRLREEELARQHQAMREAALRSLETESGEPEVATIDRARQALQESAMAMVREHPEDVAQLIRTWLSEE